MEEQLLKIEGDPAEVVQQLKESSVQVLHRFGDTLVVKGEPALDLAPEVSRFIRTMAVEPLIEVPADVSDENIALHAFRLRQRENFRRSKQERATEGEDWGEIFQSL
jgi:hypothetical protein